jgi:predicted DNA-binding transcriptional regulator AlpA
MSKAESQLLNTREAAAVVGLSAQYLYQLGGSAKGPPRVKTGGRVYYARVDLDTWSKARANRIEILAERARANAARLASRAKALAKGTKAKGSKANARKKAA